jgi:sulfate transport system permease protein
MPLLLKKPSALPGFKWALGYVVLYLLLLVLIPLGGLFFKSATLGWAGWWHALLTARVLAAFEVSFGTALAAALINGLAGLPLAWFLCRYEFPGRRLLDALIDLPFAMPTAVAGITLATLFVPQGWAGRLLAPLGITVAYTRLGITLALVFIGLPFVVRSLQPVIEELDPAVEEAASGLGASWWGAFWRVIFPELGPALLTGFSLAFARCVGEYGSVVFIAGNMPMRTEIVPLLIITKLEQYDYAGATALGSAMLMASFILLLAINHLQARLQRSTQ